MVLVSQSDSVSMLSVVVSLCCVKCITQFYGTVLPTVQGPKYVGIEGVKQYGRDQQEWKKKAAAQGCQFIPSATPGFNNIGFNMETNYVPKSRKIGPDAEFGTTYEAFLTEAIKLTDRDTGSTLFITSWNEWHEDTQIEPAKPVGAITNLPLALTHGLQYEAYGMRYLDITKRLTSSKENP